MVDTAVEQLGGIDVLVNTAYQIARGWDRRHHDHSSTR